MYFSILLKKWCVIFVEEVFVISSYKYLYLYVLEVAGHVQPWRQHSCVMQLIDIAVRQIIIYKL